MSRRLLPLNRLCHVVLHGADSLVLTLSTQTGEVVRAFREAVSARVRGSPPPPSPQSLLALCARWTPALLPLALALGTDRCVLLRGGIEASVYGGVRHVVHVCRAGQAIFTLLTLLGPDSERRRKIVVFVDSETHAEQLHAMLMQGGCLSLGCSVPNPEVVDAVRRQWDMDGDLQHPRVLVTTDACSRLLDVQDATCVVHYHFPESPAVLGARLCCLRRSFGHPLQPEARPPAAPSSVTLAVEGAGVRAALPLLALLERTGSPVPAQMRRAAARDRVRRERRRESRQLCPSLARVGACGQERLCQWRHILYGERQVNRPATLPAGTRVTLLVTHVECVTQFSGRILHYRRPPEATTTTTTTATTTNTNNTVTTTTTNNTNNTTTNNTNNNNSTTTNNTNSTTTNNTNNNNTTNSNNTVTDATTTSSTVTDSSTTGGDEGDDDYGGGDGDGGGGGGDDGDGGGDGGGGGGDGEGGGDGDGDGPSVTTSAVHLRLAAQLRRHYSRLAPGAAPPLLVPGQLYGVRMAAGFYCRARLLGVVPANSASALLPVSLVDEGRSVAVRPGELLELPPALVTRPPPLAVSVVMCGLRPAAGDCEWTPQALAFVREAVQGTVVEGSVALAAEDTLWVDSLHRRTWLPGLRAEAVEAGVHAQLMSRGFAEANPGHAAALVRAISPSGGAETPRGGATRRRGGREGGPVT
ncbi:putative ATP-dependent RNA helicase TDRD12 [Lampetra fluviatilis]